MMDVQEAVIVAGIGTVGTIGLLKLILPWTQKVIARRADNGDDREPRRLAMCQAHDALEDHEEREERLHSELVVALRGIAHSAEQTATFQAQSIQLQREWQTEARGFMREQGQNVALIRDRIERLEYERKARER